MIFFYLCPNESITRIYKLYVQIIGITKGIAEGSVPLLTFPKKLLDNIVS